MANKTKEVLEFSATSNRFIKKWNSVGEIAKHYGVGTSQFYRVLNSSRGFGVTLGSIFMYKEYYDKRKSMIK